MKLHPAGADRLPGSTAAVLATLIGALIIVGSLTGCASTDCVGPVGNPKLTPAQIAVSQGHTGERQRWGGTLVQARNLRDSTEFEVMSYPLDRCGVPRLDQAPSGRFIAVAPGYLETADYRPERLVTATGMITGTRAGEVGAATYQFPVLSDTKVRLWPEAAQAGYGRGGVRPWVTIGVGGGSGGWYGGGVGGGVGVQF
jgi:outer membrane lipoprotein